MHSIGTARRITARRFGGPDVLEVEEVEVPAPRAGEVAIRVTAAGMNPADFKRFAGGHGATEPPVHPGFEVAGVLAAVGADTAIASGGGTVGDRVVAFRVDGGYASLLVVPARDVFAAPAALDDAASANLLLAGTTAADLLDAGGVTAGTTVLLHGASGAVGVSVLQQARRIGARVIGTASPGRFDEVRRFGGEPIEYGEGLAHRVRVLAADGVDVAFDCVGTEEAAQASVELVVDRGRILTIAAPQLAERYGFRTRGGTNSAAFRDRARAGVIELAAFGELEVPVARTYPLADAAAAVAFLAEGHPGGKLALIP